MTKIVLGQKPKTFKPFPVKFEHPEGGEGVIEVTFNYRTKTEFGQYLNANQSSNVNLEFLENGKPDFEGFYAKQKDQSADYLVLALNAWDLGFELNQITLKQLSDELPAASVAIMTAYNAACTEGRLGN